MQRENLTVFEAAFKHVVIGIEKAYANDPDDPGGETVWGLSKTHNPDLFQGGELPTLEQARRIYRERYWNELYEDLVWQPQAIELFEAGVLHGPTTAVMFTQQALHLLAADLSVRLTATDGQFGPLTLDNCNMFARNSPEWANALYRAANFYQAEALVSTGRSKFMRGWFAKRLD